MEQKRNGPDNVNPCLVCSSDTTTFGDNVTAYGMIKRSAKCEKVGKKVLEKENEKDESRKLRQEMEIGNCERSVNSAAFCSNLIHQIHLDTSSHLYKRVCPSVCVSVCPSLSIKAKPLETADFSRRDASYCPPGLDECVLASP